MESKFKEEIIKTSDLTVMRGLYLSERLLRTWSEDFVDEDIGEVVSIERNELILPKGEKLEDTQLSLINFHLQANDIIEVHVSNQQRFGNLEKRHPAVWQVTANYNNKKYNLYLYATSIETTKLIVNDYLEQLVQGYFSFVAIKELDYSTLIPLDFGVEKEDSDSDVQYVDFETFYYKIEVSIVDEEMERRENFIVNAEDAEEAKEKIVKFLSFKRSEQSEESETFDFTVTIISAKTIPCDYVIDYDFSLEYLKDADEAQEV